jgi:hypothetical protein
VRQALGRSPDVADTFLKRMYFELVKDETTGTHEQATAAMHCEFHRAEGGAEGRLNSGVM